MKTSTTIPTAESFAMLLSGIVLAMALAPVLAATLSESQSPSSTGSTVQAPKEPVERLTLSPGASPIVRKGTVVGSASRSFPFSGRKGQVVSVDLRSTNTSLYFNLRSTDSLDAIYASDRGETGNQADITLPVDGEYQIDVYLFRSAARRGVKAAFTISISVKP